MNADSVKHMTQTRQLYGPNLGTLTDNLPHVEGIATRIGPWLAERKMTWSC